MFVQPEYLRPRQFYYAGKLHAPSTSDVKTIPSIDPSPSRTIADNPVASTSDIDAAIDAAKAAFRTWSHTPAVERARILQCAAALLRERNDAFAALETLDTGRPFSETQAVDLVTGADVLEYYANLAGGGGLAGERVQLRADAWCVSTKEPLGVCAGVGAWNYPVQIVLWKLAPCLAAGNCMVYKPSEFTPMHAQVLAELLTEAGLPAGVFNVVYGAGEVGAHLTAHPDVAKVSFTGQVATGRKVAASAAGNMKYVTMELGGKSPCIILPDCDIENAVDGAMMANFYSTGQVCTNGTRVFVPRSLQDAFKKRLLEKMQYVRAGDLMDMSTNFGPLSSKVHYGKVADYINHGIRVDGAKVLYGDLEKPVGIPKGCEDGYWIKPFVFTDCTDGMKITTEEIFGPVLCILPYDSVDEVVERANATALGLAAGVFSKDIDLAQSVVSRLEAGITWINTWGESPAEMSVGGWKMSGLGVENGRKGIEAWVQNRSTLVDMSKTVPTAFT